ncbi:MAG: TetR/AcrR family transcriptional regulator [Gammaproteobacteria bacterium]|nr:TetR/AcrR family transcriptional regulator [Gammaproteobacteria bacterium]
MSSRGRCSAGGSVDTRTRILEATVGMLEEHGGRGVRMGDIAAAAGISRQALYLHFASRTELLVATTRFVDERLDLEQRLAASRSASSGTQRLARFIEFWGSYIPEIQGVARALLLARDTDDAAAAAWRDRMEALRQGCRAAIEAVHAEGRLAPEWTVARASDALWTMLQVQNFEHLTDECGWSSRQYVKWVSLMASRAFVEPERD